MDTTLTFSPRFERKMEMLLQAYPLIPGRDGQHCPGNPDRCDECDYLICCINADDMCDKCFAENGTCETKARHLA